MALYTEGRVKKLVVRLKEEYDRALARQREQTAALKEENRALKARVLKLEGERREVADALILAAKERKQVAARTAAEAENERTELLLLAGKCRRLSEDLQKKYPDAEDVAAFSAYAEELGVAVGESREETFNMDDVIAPKQPLDLGKLCRSLGLMEEDA